MTLLTLITSLEAPPPNTATLRVRNSTNEFCGDRNIQSSTPDHRRNFANCPYVDGD